ncbi:interleukin-1 receptor accessory protein isoform X2 [Silurus meridionalis]|nr:interleukin-1 receptor accessory protein isoform X2 [Silurus meridionalis]XP_046718846.1 interleukin-1 receptor accessory protein isoform X2 [Silurus meridionalis]XP_046718847.1 interleukin-1 receptor accessory protein isoform X2 [Silurus meridionalis]
MFISALLFLCLMSVVNATLLEPSPTSLSGPQCVNWGVYERGAVKVYESEAGRIHCPLFLHPKLYNYAQIQNTGHTLLWYRQTHELEEPVDLSLAKFAKHRDALWIQPTSMEDRGEYICLLRNMSWCVKIGVKLDVVPRKWECDDTLHRNVTVQLHSNYTLRCPNVQHLPNKTYNVIWYHNCESDKFDGYFWEVRKYELIIYQMFTFYAGPYTCVVTYQSNGHTLNYRHTISLKAMSNIGFKYPVFLNPTHDQNFTVTVGEDTKFVCQLFLPYLNDEEPQIWWSINNKTLEELSEPRYTSPEASVPADDNGDREMHRVLYVSPFKEEDLHKEFRCSVRYGKGFYSKIVTLEEKVYVPSIELGFGLGLTLALALLLFVLYRVFWLEVHLLYRSWFGTDERDTDDKEYDVYISYARNTEEEEFVLATLRRVLEAEFGYTVCIFDRDSLPGGNLAESVLRCMQASRRVVVVLSGPCVCEKNVQRLECGLCVYLHDTCGTPLITVRWRRTLRVPCCRELAELRRCAICVHWHGAQSQDLTSSFWKRLRLALPGRPLALGRRLIDSTSSHSDLAGVALRRTHAQTRAHLHTTGERALGCALCPSDCKMMNGKGNNKIQSTHC